MFTVPLLIFKIIPDFYLIDAGSHQETPELIWKGELILNPNIKHSATVIQQKVAKHLLHVSSWSSCCTVSAKRSYSAHALS